MRLSISFCVIFAVLQVLPVATPAISAQSTSTADRPDGDASDVSTEDRAEAYYYYCLARKYEMEMSADEALTHYEMAAEKDPESAYPLVALAALHARTRQSEKALATVTRAIERDPEVAAAYRLQGTLLFTALRNGAGPETANQAIDAFEDVVRLEPNDAESRSSLARLLLAAGRGKEASVQLAEVIRLQPNAYYELYLLAQVRRAEGDTAEARRLLDQSLRIEPRQPEVRESLVELLREAGDFAAAAGIYEDALKDAPDDLSLRLKLADSLANTGESERAAELFESVLKEDPESLPAQMGLAMVHRDLKRLDRAEELLTAVVSRRPNNILARYNLAGVLEQKREHKQAIEQWKAVLALPEDAYESDRRAEFWARLGFAHLEVGAGADSVTAFREAKRHAGEDPRFDGFVVQGLLAADEISQAQSHLEAAMQEHPRALSLKLLMPRALDAAGKHEEAVEFSKSLVAEDSEDVGLASALVETYQRQNRFDDAEKFLSTRLDSHSEPTLHFLLGAVLERQKKFDLAEAQFRKVLEKNPESAPTLNYLGYMLADRSVRLDESLRYLLKAVDLDPYNGAYLDSLGWAYFRRGDLDLAEENLLKAIQSLRLTGVVYDHLGDLYFEKGQQEQAVQYWRKALAQDDDELQKDSVTKKIEKANQHQD